MAHTKAGGATRQKGNRRGKRLGVKVTEGQTVSPGEILIRQRGATFKPGDGAKLGRDYTLYSKIGGKISFKKRYGQKFVSVSP